MPTFFLEVQQNRTIPFWSHPLLVPLNSCPLPLATAAMPVPVPLVFARIELESQRGCGTMLYIMKYLE
jgi:hypothetical protein